MKKAKAYETIFNNLVELSGSEKQVKWANSIRDGFIIDIVNSAPVNYFDDENKINAVVNLFNRAKSAKFWIDEVESKGVLTFQLGRILNTKAY